MLYPQHFIDELKDRADLLRIIEPYVPLKKKGANYWGCCPFHQEKTPSFSVNPGKGFYKCFGCGKGGSAFNFVMEVGGLSFPEAIKEIAEKSGIALPEPIDDKNYQKNKQKREEKIQIADEVIELNKLALEFWEKHLADNNRDSKAAREYLENRGISEETQKTFRIGFAPESWDRVLNLLKEEGADEKLIEQSGLVSKNEKNNIYDRFRGRIIFPVLDIKGNPIAFGARILDTGEPKYLNSPETPAYIKGEHLYGLFQNQTEIRQKKYAILVEGYLDLIALYQFGVKNCVASLGTAFTEQQAKLLGRTARKVVVNYDGDKAGIKAAKRAIETLVEQDFEIKVLVLPDGNDPDDFIRSEGFDAYKSQHKNNAVPYLTFVLEDTMRGKNLALPKQKAEAIEEIMPFITGIRNSFQQRESFNQAMLYLRVEDRILQRDIWKNLKAGARFEKEIVRQQVARATQARMTVAEHKLLELLIYDRELRDEILPQMEEADYELLATASIFRALFVIHQNGLEVTQKNLLEMTEEDEQAQDFVPILMMSEPMRQPGEVIDEVLEEAENCVVALRTMTISRRILEISQELMAAEQTGNIELRDTLVNEQIQLARLKQNLESRNFDDRIF